MRGIPPWVWIFFSHPGWRDLWRGLDVLCTSRQARASLMQLPKVKNGLSNASAAVPIPDRAAVPRCAVNVAGEWAWCRHAVRDVARGAAGHVQRGASRRSPTSSRRRGPAGSAATRTRSAPATHFRLTAQRRRHFFFFFFFFFSNQRTVVSRSSPALHMGENGPLGER